MAEGYKASVTISKSKYGELEKRFKETYDEQLADSVLDLFKEVLKFDPSLNTYDKGQAKKIKEYRDKKKAEGISTYVSSGMKRHYEKRKMQTT